jgi:DNA-binding NarL/FixJ family response regulator
MSDRLRVLIVDDYPGIVKAVARQLADACDVVGSATDGCGALQAVRQLRPDLVVLDVKLADVDGLKVCSEITQAYPRTKVVVFTGADDPEVGQRAFEAGASAFVDKLALDDSLMKAIRRLEAGSR